MKLNITKKIINSHLMEGSMLPDEQITIKVDQTLWTDLTGVMGAQIIESLQTGQIECRSVNILYGPQYSDNVN